MKKECKHCGDIFETMSDEKRCVGGFINECPDCVIDNGGDTSPPKYLAVAAGNGKMSDITILEFENDSQRESYRKMWQNNSGYNKGKSCQLGTHLTPTAGIKFKLHSENRANDNHKGKV